MHCSALEATFISTVSLVLYYQNTRAEHCKLMTHDSKKVVTSERGQKVRKDGHFFRRYLLTFVFFESRNIVLGLHVKMNFVQLSQGVVPMDLLFCDLISEKV